MEVGRVLNLRDKRIMVAGGAGFVGSAVIRRLQDIGCTDIFVPRSREFDLRSEEQVARVYSQFRPQVVIHCAGLVGGIRANMMAPADFFYDNIRMDIFLVHYAHLSGVEKFVAMGTGCSYPKIPPSFPFKEEHLWDGFPDETNFGYAFAKKMLIIQTKTYHHQYGLKAVNLLPANLYGPGDHFDLEKSHVVPALVRKFVEAADEGGDEVSIWGSGSATREFLYIDDCAEAIVRAAEVCDDPEPINVGSGIETPITELVDTLIGIVNFKGRIVWDRTAPDGQPRRRLDVTRARRLLGFQASTGLTEGLRKTIDWFRAHRLEVISERR